MFDHQLSFPTTSAQVRALQAEADAQRRSVASLVREAIDRFLPQLRERRRKRQANPDEQSAVSPRTGISFQEKIVRRLLGEPTRITSAQEYGYGSLRISLKDGRCRDCKTKKIYSILELIQRELRNRPGRCVQMDGPLERRISGMTPESTNPLSQAGDRRPMNNIDWPRPHAGRGPAVIGGRPGHQHRKKIFEGWGGSFRRGWGGTKPPPPVCPDRCMYLTPYSADFFF